MTEKHKEPAVENMGFGNKVSARTRLVNDDGSFNIQRVGEAAKPFEHLVNLPLSLFCTWIVGSLSTAQCPLCYILFWPRHRTPQRKTIGWLGGLSALLLFWCADFYHRGLWLSQSAGSLYQHRFFVQFTSGLTCYALGTGLLIFPLVESPS